MRIFYLIWRGVASFSDLQTVTLQKGAGGGLEKVATWFTCAGFPGYLATFASCRDPKLTCDDIGFRTNGPGIENPLFDLAQSCRFF